MAESVHSKRKDEHVFLAEKTFQDPAQAGFDQVRLLHRALPQQAVADVDLTPGLFDWTTPLFINAMTGGSHTTGEYNHRLGALAHALHLPIASGSQAVALREPALAKTFQGMRKAHPDGFIMANLGASHSWQAAQDAVAMLDANALQIHLNAVQETVMPEGDRAFSWLTNIADIQAHLDVPVIVKEVGNGMNREDFQALRHIGVHTVDVGGRGGTNFARIENLRRPNRDYAYLDDFGQTTVESLLEAQDSGLTITATGGVRSPLDVIKALRLGASAVGLSGLVLHWLIQDGDAQAQAHLERWLNQLPALFAMLGAKNQATLATVPVVLSSELASYQTQRELPHP